MRRADHRRHRPVRAERGVRRAGARLPRPLRHRRRRPAGQPVGRRDRHRSPAGLLRRTADDPAGPAVRRAPRGPLRPHRDVHRHRHGRHGHLGEPALDGGQTSERARAATERGRHQGAAAPGDRARAGPAGRPDHAGQRLRPHQAEHASARAGWPAWTRRSPRRSPPTRRSSRSPASRTSSASARTSPACRSSPTATQALEIGRLGPPGLRPAQGQHRADVRVRQRRGDGRRPGAGAALPLPDAVRPARRRSRCPRSPSAWCPAGAAPSCCRT